jgi:hypothetical protein
MRLIGALRRVRSRGAELGLVVGIVVLGDAALELLDALANGTAEHRKPLGPEEQKNDDDDDDGVSYGAAEHDDFPLRWSIARKVSGIGGLSGQPSLDILKFGRGPPDIDLVNGATPNE